MVTTLGTELLLKICSLELITVENNFSQQTNVILNAKDLSLFQQFLRLEDIPVKHINNIVKLNTKKNIKVVIQDLYEFIDDTKKYRLLLDKQRLYNCTPTNGLL